MTPERTFRDDINGLRAWAVVSVILFHFGIPGFDGGFVGVDIFFVISGFLMTGIIIKALEQTGPDGKHSLSLISFYLSRGRRIIPALLVLCMALLAAGWFFLPNNEYRMLGSHSTSALGFLSNIKFWLEAGYFDAASHEKWLLHTWSLSVEWQFYMILPLIMLLVWKLVPGRNAATVAITAILIASVAASILISRTHPSAAFYLLHTRAWEMLAGGLVFLLSDKVTFSIRVRESLYFIGFALLAISIAAFDSATVWPGHNALLPVTGTVMVLFAARQNGLLSGHPILQRLGDWSYSLYLWHWPLAVALTYLQLQNDPSVIGIALVLCLILGWLSYRLIETPARLRTNTLPRFTAAITFAGLVAVAAAPGIAIYLKNGVPGRLPSNIEAIFAEAQNKNPRIKECLVDKGDTPGCTYGGEMLGVIVVGDSHAASIVRAVERALPHPGTHVLDWTYSGCYTITGLRLGERNDCGDFVKRTIERSRSISSDVPMIVSNRYSMLFWGPNEHRTRRLSPPRAYINTPYEHWSDEYREEMRAGYIDTICELAKHRDVYLLGPSPELKLAVPRNMGRQAQLGRNYRVGMPRSEYEDRNRYAFETLEMAANECGAVVLDPAPYLCDDTACYGDIDGMPIYFDDDHLNERGADLLLPLFSQIMTSMDAVAETN